MESIVPKAKEIYPVHHIDSHNYCQNDIFAANNHSVLRVAYSHDDRLFAWISGESLVTIFLHSGQSKHNNAFTSPLTISCNYPVKSLAFGSANLDNCYCVQESPEKNCSKDCLVKEQAFWTGFTTFTSLVLATGHSNGRIRIWNPFTGKLLLELADTYSSISDLVFHPRSKLILASVASDGKLKFWDLHDDGNLYKSVQFDNKPIHGCCWSANGSLLAVVGANKMAYLYSILTESIKFKLVGHYNDVIGCSFSPDSSLLATVSWDTRAIVWDTMTGEQIIVLEHQHPPPRLIFASGANNGWIRGVSFSPDGVHLATVADDGLVRFWNILHKDQPESVGKIESPLCCSYSSSGHMLVVGTKHGVVNFWEASTCIKSLQYECRLAIRCLVHNPQDISKLEIPNSLKHFLMYRILE